MSAVSVCEAMTTLKQYEQACPGRDLQVQVHYTETEWVDGRIECTEKVVTVACTGIVWGVKGAVVVAEEVP